jgi:hypothetical protein
MSNSPTDIILGIADTWTLVIIAGLLWSVTIHPVAYIPIAIGTFLRFILYGYHLVHRPD